MCSRIRAPGPGAVLALVLLAAPVLLLLLQAVRLGAAQRDRRLAALRFAGATRGEIRGLGAVEVGVPATVGALVGLGLYALLRVPFGAGGTLVPSDGGQVWAPSTQVLALIPVSVSASWWQVVLVVVGIGLLGAGVGWRVTGAVLSAPLTLTRRQSGSRPRPWGLLALLGAVVVLRLTVDSGAVVPTVVGVGLVAIGLMGLAPFVAWAAGRVVEGRAGSAALLLAGRRLVTEPRTVGRAAAAVAAIALVASGIGGVAATLVIFSFDDDDYTEHGFYVVAMVLVALLVVVALVVVIGSMAVHAVESLRDRARSMAGLRAAGTPYAVIERSQRWEAGMVALPMAAVGGLVGAVLMGQVSVSVDDPRTVGVFLAIEAGTLLLTLGGVLLAVVIAHRMVRPWSRRAVSLELLRTE